MTEEMAGWHHQLNGYEFEQALGDSEGQEILACCSPWDSKESDTTEWLNNNKNHLGFLVAQMVKTPPAMLGDLALIP